MRSIFKSKTELVVKFIVNYKRGSRNGRKTKCTAGTEEIFADPIMVSMIVVLLVFLALFILYPLLMLLVDSFYAEGTITLDVFKRVLNLERFRNAFKNTLTLGFIVGFASTALVYYLLM